MNKDTLKKHHFWFLAGFVPLLVLIAVLVLSSSVGSAIEAKKKAITDATSALQSKANPKPQALLKKLEEQNASLGTTRGKLWKDNWDRQKPLFTWPAASAKLKAVEKLDLKFGDPVPNDEGERDEFGKREVYLAEYSNKSGTGMADRVAPTQFLGSWQQVLRHVGGGNWGVRAINSDQIWLALEDIWVERSILNAVKSVNDQIGAFERVTKDAAGLAVPDDKLRRKFASRVWEIELWTESAGSGRTRLRGKLTNITDRLQLLGIGNTMTLRVWVEDAAKKPNAWFDLKIRTEFLPGKGAMKDVKDAKGVVTGQEPANVLDIIPSDELHVLPNGTSVAEISKVVQVFDARTVPVKRIDRVVLGQLDARNANAVLKKTEKMAKDDEAAASAAGATPTGGAGGNPAGPPPGMAVPGGRGATGSSDGGTSAGGGAAVAGPKEGPGTVETALDANRARYLDISPNVRRMPIGIVLVIDQAYLQDVLLAYANSPLRFQITQVHLSRFRGTLEGLGTTGSSGSSGAPPGIMSSGQGMFGSGFGPGTEGSPMGPPPGMSVPGGLPPRGGVGGGPPPGTSAGGLGTSAGGLSAGPGGGLGSGMLTTVSEAQLTSGLIEVCIYGIVSLYEKYDEKKAAEQATQQPGANPTTTTPPTTPPVGTTPPTKDGKDATSTDGKGAKDVTPKGATETPPQGVTPPETPMPPKGDKTPKDATPPVDPKGGKPGT
ncbi:MAG TPA: hypothetical protein VMZ71_03270 [Gemmataceae bacterium]|nr:hypothetical protein [Gemmataceae bacterium]